MKKALDFQIHGIKCDSCNYRDEGVTFEDYHKWVNKPCPKCGENLLTEADFANVQMLAQLSELANSILPPRKDNEKVAKVTKVTVEMDGSGKMDFKLQ